MAYITFILDTSNGFTQSAVERLNESIRMYAWCILGSQAKTRSNIIGEGTSFGAQKQFLANIEDLINWAVDIPANIKRYQDTLKYARSKVDYVIGTSISTNKLVSRIAPSRRAVVLFSHQLKWGYPKP